MPVFNAEKFLAEAIESILSQTYRDFELLIINDGSSDRSGEIIKSYSDARIRLFENESNIKLIATLNKGIDLSAGEYIARMDADDISLPERLAKQVEYLDQHPSVGLCGSYLKTLGLEQDYVVKYATDHDTIRFKLFFDAHFPHPAAIIRKSVLTENHLRFEKEYIHAEDFELWNRMAEVCRVAIIPEVLVLKRSHREQVSVKYELLQQQISRKIREELIQKLGVQPQKKEMDVYEAFLQNKKPVNEKEVVLLLDFFEKLVSGNRVKNIYRQDLFVSFFAEKYWDICNSSTHLGAVIYRKFKGSLFHRQGMVSGYKRLRLLLKSLLRYPAF